MIESETEDINAHKRTQHQYQGHQQEIQPDRSGFLELAEQYQEVMTHLNEADLEVVQNYQKYVFNFSAAAKTVLYKAGIKDRWVDVGKVDKEDLVRGPSGGRSLCRLLSEHGSQ